MLSRATLKLFSDKTNHRYAVERTDSFIKAWFWSRSASGIPPEVQNGAGSLNTDDWVSASKLSLS